MMKYLLGFFALLLVGAGCLGFGGKGVEGEWALSFDLPDEWVMMRAYSETGSAANALIEIERTAAEVVLQTTSSHIFTSEKLPEDLEQYGDYVTEDYLKVSVLRLDPRRIIPSEAEDLGEGFFKESDTVYYLKAEEENYKFTVHAEGREPTDALEVIRTAEVVTVDPDSAE